VLNWLFFGGVVVGALIGQLGFADLRLLPIREEPFLEGIAVSPWLVLEIFFFNLVLSGFVLLTLTGLAFFALSPIFLLIRALLWGTLHNALSTPALLAAFPTLILEGEGYVFAALAGVILGLAWLKPRLIYPEEELSRSQAVKQAFKESTRICVLAALILFVAAVVETATLATF
jgi:hypothetical protein